MKEAYDDPTLKGLTRSFRLAADGSLAVRDAFVFSRQPKALEEGFVTYEPAAVLKGRKQVRIGKGRRSVVLTCSEGAGRFDGRRFEEEAKDGRAGEVVTRIVFTPQRLEREMVFEFAVR
jgi:hypothetical protein